MPASEVTYSEQLDNVDEFFFMWRLPNEELHRADGPAAIVRFDGAYSENYLQDGLEHRIDGPAVFEFYPNLERLKLRWYRYGESHRLDGPAVIEYDFNGTATFLEWWVDGRLIKRVERPSDTAPSDAV